MLQHDRPRAADLAGDARHGRHVLGVEGHAGGSDELDAVELLEKIEMPEVAPELAVGDRLQADLLLALHGARDAAVLDFLQFLRRDLRGARVAQLGRTQQAADLVGVEWRSRHAGLLARQSSFSGSRWACAWNWRAPPARNRRRSSPNASRSPFSARMCRTLKESA